MRIFTLKFPELAHLPVERRREIVTHCLADSSFTRIRSKFSKLGVIYTITVALLTFFVTSTVEMQRWPLALGLIAVGIALTTLLIHCVRLLIEARNLRRLVKTELSLDAGNAPTG